MSWSPSGDPFEFQASGDGPYELLQSDEELFSPLSSEAGSTSLYSQSVRQDSSPEAEGLDQPQDDLPEFFRPGMLDFTSLSLTSDVPRSRIIN